MKKKDLRMLAGIILHPLRVILGSIYRKERESVIRECVRDNWWMKNHRRMHEMSTITGTAYTDSALLGNLYQCGL